MNFIVPNRSDLTNAFPGNPKMQKAVEQLFERVTSTSAAVTAGVGATTALVDATVITLSPNEALGNERVLAVDPASLVLTDGGPGETIRLALRYPIATNGYAVTLNFNADANIAMPLAGRVPSSADGPYANDAAAAAAGIEIGEWYAVTGGSVAWRQV